MLVSVLQLPGDVTPDKPLGFLGLFPHATMGGLRQVISGLFQPEHYII